MNAALLIGVIASSIMSGTSLLYATLGEVVGERAGIVNLGLEGIMLIGAASGFAASNIGDTVQSRSNVASERDSLTEKLGHLRQDRNAIAEARAPSAIEALIQREQPRVPAANWKSSAGCSNVTLSAKVCDAINALRQAKADAERRDL